MLTVRLNNLADEALDKRQAEREAMKTPEEITENARFLRAFFLSQLGEFPERTELNAHVTGGGACDGYRYEKVIFESRPGMFVTGVMFIPDGTGPFPGVLVPCGHSSNGKCYESYQRACMILAQNGICAFIYDPIGQGERCQALDENGKPRFPPTIEHMFIGVGCILFGQNTATYRIWDGMRALDYLCERPEVDPKRIGCTGNSGGGTLTSYLMALDDRIICAAPGCYLTSFKRLLEKAGPQDAEQCIYNQIAKGFDHADYIVARAPKPTLMLTATNDFFDIRGAWDSFREAKRIYGKMGFPERVELLEANEEHGFTATLRIGMARWMRRWLSSVDEPLVEKEGAILTDQEMQCSPTGQVLQIEGARSVFQINIETMEKLAERRKALRQSATPDEVREKIRKIAVIRPLKELPAPEVKSLDVINRGGVSIQKFILTPEPGILLPGLLFSPPSPDGEAYLYLNAAGKDVDAAPGGRIEQLVLKNHIVFAVDLRGCGETACHSEIKKYDECFGDGWDAYYRAYMLGRSYIGMRAEDALACARWLAAGPDGAARQVHVVAIGDMGLPALHAAALEPDLFASVHVENALSSWEDLVRRPFAKKCFMFTINGALSVYDIPDLAALAPAGKIEIENPLAFSREDELK
jgi:dienelactone hydrolase